MDIKIRELFEHFWTGDHVLSSIENMRAQLHKSLTNQIDGYWSGHSAYQIMTKGGFLVDGKSCTHKVLTELGEKFMSEYKAGDL